jgi:hypothetical protein
MDFDDMEDSYFAFLSSHKKVGETTQDRKIAAVVTEIHQADNEKSKIRSRVGSVSGVQAGNLSLNASSLPSVPSLPSLARGSSSPQSGSYGVQSASSLALAVPQRTFAGGGSRPGTHTTPASDPGARLSAAHEAQRFGAAVIDRGGPRSGKMVYVLVAVLIMAICVLAVLLFSGGGPPAATGKRGALDPAPRATTLTER